MIRLKLSLIYKYNSMICHNNTIANTKFTYINVKKISISNIQITQINKFIVNNIFY